ncbi:hypothetical protein ACUNGZ_25240, partial [Serratia sp. IR-2025]
MSRGLSHPVRAEFACGIGSARQTRLVLRRPKGRRQKSNKEKIKIFFYVDLISHAFFMPVPRCLERHGLQT